VTAPRLSRLRRDGRPAFLAALVPLALLVLAGLAWWWQGVPGLVALVVATAYVAALAWPVGKPAP